MAYEKCTGGNDSGRCSGVDTAALTLTGPRELFLITSLHIRIVTYLIYKNELSHVCFTHRYRCGQGGRQERGDM